MLIDTSLDIATQLALLERTESVQVIRTEQHPESGNFRTHYICDGLIKTAIYGKESFWRWCLNIPATDENIKKFTCDGE